MPDRSVWIPEAPNFPGLYANAKDYSQDGKIKDFHRPPVEPSTYSIELARQFTTREECQAWCDASPVPRFVPMGHEFVDRTDAAAAA